MVWSVPTPTNVTNVFFTQSLHSTFPPRSAPTCLTHPPSLFCHLSFVCLSLLFSCSRLPHTSCVLHPAVTTHRRTTPHDQKKNTLQTYLQLIHAHTRKNFVLCRPIHIPPASFPSIHTFKSWPTHNLIFTLLTSPIRPLHRPTPFYTQTKKRYLLHGKYTQHRPSRANIFSFGEIVGIIRGSTRREAKGGGLPSSY